MVVLLEMESGLKDSFERLYVRRSTA